MLKNVIDLKSVKGLKMRMSYHCVVLCKIKLVRVWIKRETKGEEVGIIK